VLGKGAGGFFREAADPLAKDSLHRFVQPGDLLVGHFLRQLCRRHPSAVQDLVGIGIPDAREQARVGQRALGRMVFPRQRFAEPGEVHSEHLDPPAVELRESRFACNQVERRPLLRRGLGKHERAVGKVERRECSAAADLRPALSPVQPARNHQVQDQEQISLEREDDSLADPSQREDPAAAGLPERRSDRAQQKRARQPHRLESLTDDARFERGEIAQDVRQLRHGIEAYNPVANADPYGGR